MPEASTMAHAGDNADALDAAVAALGRHGLSCTRTMLKGGDGDVGKLLLDHVAQQHTSLLVMGGYGRWRWREMVLGGATRHIFQHMTVPVFLSH